MSETSGDSPPPSYTVGDLIAAAAKGAPYYATQPKKGTFTKKLTGNVHERFPEELRERFRDQYRLEFRESFRRQAALEFEKAFPIEKEKTPTPEIYSNLTSTSSSQTIPSPFLFNDSTASLAMAPMSDENPTPVEAPGSANEARPGSPLDPGSIPNPFEIPADFLFGDAFEVPNPFQGPSPPQVPSPFRLPNPFQTSNPPQNVNAPILRTGRDPWIGGEVPILERGFEGIRRDGEFPEALWRRFDEVHAGGFFDPAPIDPFEHYVNQVGEFAGEIITGLPGEQPMSLGGSPNGPSNTDQAPQPTASDDSEDTDYDEEADQAVERAIEMFLEQGLNPTLQGMPDQNQTQEEDSDSDVEMVSPGRSESESSFEFPAQRAASRLYEQITQSVAERAARQESAFLAQVSRYLENAAQAAADNASPPVHGMATLELGHMQVEPAPKRLKINFQRSLKFRQELRHMQRDGRYKDNEQMRLVNMEIRFPELQEIADSIYKRMGSALVLHEDLLSRAVGFSRWTIEGCCPDPEVFDMLMSFQRIMRAVQNPEAGVTLLDIVPEYHTPERRIVCQDFTNQIFKVPVKYLNEDQLRVADSDDSSDSEDYNPPRRFGRQPVAALCAMGKIAIRFNRSNGEFCFSGLYHLVRFNGRNHEAIDLHKHERDGDPYAPGSYEALRASFREYRYGRSSAWPGVYR
ncbi:hypothetical protein TWF718_008693 [Orbilia javanica]|uniref:Uncharacterized protein n=1 Tax=Orbilia javanica TaxID=47235 RepID=A0AAN8NRP4_9PEZI